MICIYRVYYPGILDTSEGRRLSCKAKWAETSAENLRNAIGAIDHNPWEGQLDGQLVIEVDGVLYEREVLPKGERKELLRRCRHWLDNLYRARSISLRPVFGL